MDNNLERELGRIGVRSRQRSGWQQLHQRFDERKDTTSEATRSWTTRARDKFFFLSFPFLDNYNATRRKPSHSRHDGMKDGKALPVLPPRNVVDNSFSISLYLCQTADASYVLKNSYVSSRMMGKKVKKEGGKFFFFLFGIDLDGLWLVWDLQSRGPDFMLWNDNGRSGRIRQTEQRRERKKNDDWNEEKIAG